MDTVVYVDVLLFINTIMTYAVLITTEKLIKRSAKVLRLIAASFIGSLFSLLVFFTADSFIIRLLIRVVSSLLLVLAAFSFINRKAFFKTVLAVILVSLVYSGMMILIYQLFRPPNMVIVNNVVYFEFNPLILLGSTAFIYILITVFQKLFRERIKNTVVPLSFTVNGSEYSCIAKIDTGCNLTEPFSGAPVIIVDTSIFKIGDPLHQRVIPYSSVGNSSILYGIKAEQVVVDRSMIEREIYIAATDIRSDHIQAIINSEIVR